MYTDNAVWLLCDIRNAVAAVLALSVRAMGKQVIVPVRMPQELHDALVEMARRDDRSLSSMIRVLLQRAVDAHDAHKAGGELGHR